VGRLVVGTPEGADVTVAEIVAENEEQIGLASGLTEKRSRAGEGGDGTDGRGDQKLAAIDHRTRIV
jgi:hypothetical protein